MKKKIISLIAILFASVFVFVGCANGLQGGPELDDMVSSNGSMVVRKGNYLYFANGYFGTSKMVDGDNKEGKVEFSSLYRAELDNNGNLIYDDEGNLTKVEKVISKVVGFENCGIYIFDDKIYYASPNDQRSGSSVDFTKTDFYMANLDGTGATRIYKTNVGSTSIKFAFYKYDGEVYLSLYDSSDLYIISCSDKNVVKAVEGVQSVVMPKVESYVYDSNDNMTRAESFIYYTRSTKTEDYVLTGNIMGMINLKDKEEIKINIRDLNVDFEVKGFEKDNLVYTRKGINEDNAYYYVAKFKEDKVKIEDAVKLTNTSYKVEPVAVFEVNTCIGVIVKNASNQLVWKKPDIMESPKVLSDKELTLVAVKNGFAYAYDSDKVLYMINIKSPENIKTLTNKDDDVLDFSMNVKIDFDSSGNVVYFYKQFTGDDENDGAFYLVRVKTYEAEMKLELVGKLLDKHVKTESEE
ncbi:MAG: hypothetical protein KBT30_00260 [Clostridiales bacterium]|nr:hypothetical protein [Candidatus Apopatousia equi]